MQPFTENIDKLRGKQESLAFWQRRRRFLVVHWNKFPVEELNNLSYCYSSVMVYSCRYSPEIMNRLYDLAMEVASHQQKEGKRNARCPQEIQEKWELAMTEPDTFGRIMLNTGEDPTIEWTENEEEDDGGQKSTDVERKGQICCSVQSTPHTVSNVELKTQIGKAPNKIQQFAAKADPCLQRNHEENLLINLNESVTFVSTDPLKLKIDTQTNPLIRTMVQQKNAWQQNTGVYERSPQDNNYNKETLSTKTNSPHQRVTPSGRNKLKTPVLYHSPQAYQMHCDLPKQKCTVNTASFLNRHCMVERSPDRSLIWHPLIQTGVKEKIQAKEPLGVDGMYKCIDKKPTGSFTGIQNKAERPHPSTPVTASSKIQQADLGRKEKVVTFRTQPTLNKSSGKKMCVKKECVDGVVKAPNALTKKGSSFENMKFREFHQKRNHSLHVLNNQHSTPQTQFQSRFYHNEYVTLRQRDQSKLSAASKPHPKALQGEMCRKGLPSDRGHSESQAREKDLKLKQAKCASTDFVEEVPRKKSYTITQENTSRRPHSQGGRMTRVVYPSVKSQPTIGGKAEHSIKPATGKSSIPSSRANQGHYNKGLEPGVKQGKADQSYCKSLELGVMRRQADTGAKPSQGPEEGKPNRFLLKTFLHNLLKKARN